jgi:hypothetical protein
MKNNKWRCSTFFEARDNTSKRAKKAETSLKIEISVYML